MLTLTLIRPVGNWPLPRTCTTQSTFLLVALFMNEAGSNDVWRVESVRCRKLADQDRGQAEHDGSPVSGQITHTSGRLASDQDGERSGGNDVRRSDAKRHVPHASLWQAPGQNRDAARRQVSETPINP